MTEQSTDDRQFDGATDCLTCDRVNVSAAVHGLLQLVSCDTNGVDSLDEALAYVEWEARVLRGEAVCKLECYGCGEESPDADLVWVPGKGSLDPRPFHPECDPRPVDTDADSQEADDAS